MVTIFTDFDGVLVDTVREAYVLCRKALYGIEPSRYVEKTKLDKFVRFKFLVFNSWQFLYLMKVLSDKHIKTDSEFIENYKYLIRIRDYNEEKEFEQEYLKAKEKLVKENNVLLLEKIEEKMPFCDMLFNLQDKFEIVVVSRNNTFDIKSKLERYKITGGKIYGKEELSQYKNKAEFISKYMADNNIEKAYFIDDNSYNLKPCADIPNLKCLLAGWGNIAPNEKGYSPEEIIKIITNQ